MDTRITYFSAEVLRKISLPERFTFPFAYTPHPLTLAAAGEVQDYLASPTNFEHNFGLNHHQVGPVIGKMFGVLVVKDTAGKIGYLSGFSGKLAGTNLHARFVPPVFDMLTENSFFLQEEEILNRINREIAELEKHPALLGLKDEHRALEEMQLSQVTDLKTWQRANKEKRRLRRETEKERLSPQEYAALEEELARASLADKRQLRQALETYKEQRDDLAGRIAPYEEKIETLRKERREKSAALQEELFSRYAFLNQYGTPKSLGAIFRDTVYGKPPAGAGECATPKLLQYAFLQGYRPLAMAEFWWGASPRSEIRKHRHFYPACTGKCEPILKHMLEGLPVDENPLLYNAGHDKALQMVYEEEDFVVIHKPAKLLSVPGIHIRDSVYTRLKALWNGREPLIIHRLDMDTSGLLVVARTKEAHKHIQRQFLKRTVIKRYTALLEGEVAGSAGEIDLPLRGDFDDRPRQLVCFEHGKRALTRWERISVEAGRTRVHFFPVTGRTHQLRMHAAHPRGLNAPIVGDDLYGTAADRLHLHAAYLEFTHPRTKERLHFEWPEDTF